MVARDTTTPHRSYFVNQQSRYLSTHWREINGQGFVERAIKRGNVNIDTDRPECMCKCMGKCWRLEADRVTATGEPPALWSLQSESLRAWVSWTKWVLSTELLLERSVHWKLQTCCLWHKLEQELEIIDDLWRTTILQPKTRYPRSSSA